MAVVCPRCGSDSFVKSGCRKEKSGKITQLCRCKKCKYHFRLLEGYKPGMKKPQNVIEFAISLSKSENPAYSTRGISKMILEKFGVKVSHVAVARWLFKSQTEIEKQPTSNFTSKGQSGALQTMPTKKGIRKPRHKPETKELAVSLYVSDPRTTLKEVAAKLNNMFHFDPPLSYDSVGRWVQEKKQKMKRPGDLIWLKRRQKYGKSGLRIEKREALSKHRETQWSDQKYRELMSQRMSRIPQDVKKKIVGLYQEGTMPSKIKRILKQEQMYVPAHSTLYQILNKNKVPIWHPTVTVNPIDSIIDIPCFTCILNKEISPYYCFPASCQRLEEWLLNEREKIGVEAVV